jgi:hypothetical protein
MSLVHDAHLPDAQAQTHALVIGVGDYPHLPGGSQAQIAPARQSYGLQSLDSPAWSAVEFAAWLTAHLQNRRAPLGTVDLLVSAPPGAPAQLHGFDVPTMAGITTAFNAWEARCHKRADNVAVFYFCGHGFQREVMMLLPADFGNPAVGVVWNNIIDFTSTQIGLIDCMANTQLYLVDACRETPVLLLRDLHGHATALKTTATLQYPTRNAPVFQSATTGTRAHGEPGKVSYFTSAIIECLKSTGARGMNGSRWAVSTNSLGVALQEYMKRTQVPGVGRLTCDTGAGQSNFDTDIHEFTGTADVLASITCDRDAALAAATFAISSAAVPRTPYPANGAAVELRLPSGQYDIEATFAAGTQWQPRNPQPEPQLVMPPRAACTVEVGP